MFKREHAMRETYDILTEAENARKAKDIELTERKMKEKEDFYDAMNRIRKQRELEEANYENTSNALYDNHLQTVIEAIYISAVNEVFSLTDDGIAMAQRLVSNYIKENGGARHIMESKSGKTYLLDFMFECASTAHDKDMLTFLEAEDADKKEDEEEKKAKEEVEEDKEKDNSDPNENESGEEIKLGDADGDGKDDAEEANEDSGESGDESEKSEEASDSGKDEDTESSDSETEEPKDRVDELDTDDEEESTPSGEEAGDTEEAESSEEGEEKADDVDDGFADADAPDPGMEDAESSTDEEFDTKDSKEDMFEKLENDDTVASAVDVIAKRVADAEAEFIKKNAEDKQKIEAIADKIDERIKAVTDTDKSGEEKEAEQEGLKQEATHMITNVREDRPKGIFESMFNINADSIIKDKALMEAYSLDNGKLDFNRIEEATVVQYGFLEFLNTVQLENVNEDYIRKVLKQEV